MNKEIEKIIKRISKDYLHLLIWGKDNLNNQESFYLFIIEIIFFWRRKEKEVRFIVDYLKDKEDLVTFHTAATTISANENEHFALLLSADYCVYDDPLPSFLTIVNGNLPNKDTWLEKAKTSINDNIYVLENLIPRTIILPLRYLLIKQEDNERIKDASNNYFLSMFKKELKTLDDYRNEINNENDFLGNLKDGVENQIMFFDNDDSLIDNIKNFSKENQLSFKDFSHEAHFAFFCLINQAFMILHIAAATEFVPFIRYKPAMVNLFNLIQTIKATDTKMAKDQFYSHLDIEISTCHYLYQKMLNVNIDNSLIKRIEENSFIPFLKYLKNINYEIAPQIFNNYLDRIMEQDKNKSS